jgi:sugar phosphate isomerase/epimerase
MNRIGVSSTGLSLALVAMAFASPLKTVAAPIPEDVRIGGFAVGSQAWTFNRFSVFEAIEKTAQAGARVIELYPGQKLSPAEPDIKFDHNASDEVIQKVKDKLAQHRVVAVNYGVVGVSGEAEWRKVFELGRKLGLYAITTEAVGDLDILEKLVKEYDIRVGIHEHPRRPNNADYKVWDPNYVLSVVKDRDLRIGASADTGHWASSNVNPLEALRILRGRIISVHLKERPEIGQARTDMVFGAGVLNIAAILDELRAQGFRGNIAIEYETNWENNVPEVAQCIGFFRGYATCHR